jgi:hypothetical protein
MGLFLMESLRITRLFPVIGALPDKTRVRMIWVSFTIMQLARVYRPMHTDHRER